MRRLKLDIQRFATSGTLTTPGNSDGTSFYFHWSRQSYSIADNKSTIYWQIGINAAYTYHSNAVKLGPTTVNGTVIHNGGTYSNISSGTHTMFEGTMDIYHNQDGTKSFSASLSGWTWESTWTSADNSNNPFVLDTIPRYATCTQSLRSKTETSITMNWSSDSTIDYVWYSTNNGTNWTAVGGVNSTSGSYTISNLSANTTYNIKTRVRRKDSQLTTDSTASSIATYNWPNCTSAPNFTIGNSVTLQFYNPLNRTFDIRMWSHSASAFVSDSITISGTSYTFTPDASTLYTTIPNAKSSVYNIDSTYNTHKIVKTGGSYSVNETTNKPTFSDFDYEDTNATTLALTGDSSIVVQNYSNVRANISVANKAVAKNNATMSKYNLVIGNATTSVNYSDSESVSTPSINNVSSNIINLYAEDSRGLTTLVTKTATLKAYTNIQKGQINVARAGNVGTGVTLTYNGTLWGQSFGQVTNTAKSARYRFKKTNEDWPQTWNGTTTITPTTTGNDYSFTGGIAGDLGNTGFSAEYSFNIEVEVFDELSSTVFSFTLGTGIPHIAVADNGIAIKQPYDDNGDSVLQVNGKTSLKGNTSITGTLNASSNINSNGFLKEKNSQITPIDITDYSGTLLSKIKELGTNGIYRATWFSRTDGGTSNISDRPTGSTNAGFVCTATCNRWASNSDYRYYVEAYVQNDRIGYFAIVETVTSSISWIRQEAQKLEATLGRPTNANVGHTYENGKAHCQLLLVTSSMTSNKPSSDGYILHCSWDNSSPYNSQLFLPNNTGNVPIQFRGCNNGTWGSWETIPKIKALYSNDSGTQGTVTLSETSANFTYLLIQYRITDASTYVRSAIVFAPNGKRTALDYTNNDNAGNGWLKNKEVNISGTSITVNSVIEVTLKGGTTTNTDRIFITKVLGIR